jgi:hypothetical protein
MVTVEAEPVSHAHFFTGILNATVSILGCLVGCCMLRPVSGAMQVELTLPATSTPLGNVSVSGPLRVASVVFALFKVIVRIEVPPAAMVAGLKALPSVTEEGAETVNVATAGAALLPLLVTKAPTASELM